MTAFGILIDYDFCTGCLACEVACQQENDYPAGKLGIKVTEFILESLSEKPMIYYLPFPTDLCDLCAQRTARREPPACVKHCQAVCMRYGPIDELTAVMQKQAKTVLFRPL